ncbi:MAG: DUF2059 domain-containing protein [Hyphomicrobiaceae bacterium]
MLHRAALVAATCLALLASSAALRAQTPDPARVAAAKEMMQSAGVAKQFDEVMPLLARQLSASFIAVAPDKADEIRQVFSELAAKFVDRKNELIDKIAAAYADQLTLDELNAIAAFYRSPVGAKFVEVQPQMMRKAMALGQRWGAQIGREIEEEARRELQRRGIPL